MNYGKNGVEMTNPDGCLFLRECVCLRPGPGVCNRCGEDTKHDAENQCWYCGCQCNTKNCTIDRNPDKKYFKVRSTKDLFEEFQKLGDRIKSLNAIVQNDMVVDLEELKDWLAMAGKYQKALGVLVKRTAEEILKKPL